MSGRMRWGWRLALFVISLFLLLILLSPLAYFWGETPFKDGTIDIKVNAWIASLAILLVSVASVKYFDNKYFDKRPLGSLGLKLHEAWRQELFIGICLGAFLSLLQLPVALVLLSVKREVATLDLQSPFLMLIGDVRGAVGEELLFRGFPLQVLIEGIGIAPALFVSTVLFGLAHLQEQGWLGVVHAGGGGILLAVSYLKTRALWMPIGIHFAFNYFVGLLEMLVGIHFILSTPLVLATLFIS